MIKRIASVLLALALLAVPLAGCGGQEGGGPDQSGDPVQTGSPSPAGNSPEPSPSQDEPSPSGEDPAPAEWPAAELAMTAFTYGGTSAIPDSGVQIITMADNAEDAAFYVENAYGLDMGLLEDFAIVRGVGASALEVAVLTLRDAGDAETVSGALLDYLPLREADFTGYAPKEAEMVSDAMVMPSGRYVCLLICPDPTGASAAVRAVFEGAELPELPGDPAETTAPDETPAASETPTASETPAPPDPAKVRIPVIETYWYMAGGNGPRDSLHPDRPAFSPPNEEDMSLYDTSAILAAWETGDEAGLSDKDRATLSAAREVLGSILTEGMTSLEKEIAIYGWCVGHFDYDWTLTDAMVPTPRESFEPYGGLVNHRTVCLGSATTFQLLMDMAGVECITVVGADDSNRGDHAWNMVRLYGNWYCVDVGWDSNIREEGVSDGWSWQFFNVTSDYMAASNHQWDYANTPEAVTPGNGLS